MIEVRDGYAMVPCSDGYPELTWIGCASGLYVKETFDVLASAAGFSKELKSSGIGTEHLLLGLVAREDMRALIESTRSGPYFPSVNTELTLKTIKFIFGEGEREFKNPTYTPRAKIVMRLAHADSRRAHTHILPIHLLGGMIVEGDNIAVGILEAMGVNYEKIFNVITPQE